MMKQLFKAFGIFCLMGIIFTTFQIVMLTCCPEWSSSLAGLYTIQSLSLIVVFGLSAIWGIHATEHINPFRASGLTNRLGLRNGLIIALLAVTVQPLVSWTEALNSTIQLPPFFAAMEQSAAIITERLMNTHSVGRLMLNIAVVALIPAICEELMFRGWIQRRLQGAMSPHLAVWVTAIIFSAVHMQFAGFVPRLLLGAALGYVYLFSGSLTGSILLHGLNNALATIGSFLVFNGVLAETGTTWILALASAAVTGAALYYLWKYNSESTKGSEQRTA